MKGIVITPADEICIADFEAPLYKSVGKAVGGFIEIVHTVGLCPPYCIVVNDQGLLDNLPENRIGCLLYGTYFHGSPIVGNIVVLKEGMTSDGRDFVPMEESELQSLYSMLKGFELTPKEEKEILK